MKIALDLDGVVIDPHTIWFERLGKNINRKINFSDVTYHSLEKAFGLDTETVMKAYTPDIYENCLPEEGAINGVRRLYYEITKEIVIVSRTDSTFDTVKIEWLKKHFPDINFDIRYSRKGEDKSIYLTDCDFFVDDFEENFKNVKSHCLLYDKPWNQHTNLGIRVKGWKEVLNKIHNLCQENPQ